MKLKVRVIWILVVLCMTVALVGTIAAIWMNPHLATYEAMGYSAGVLFFVGLVVSLAAIGLD